MTSHNQHGPERLQNQKNSPFPLRREELDIPRINISGDEIEGVKAAIAWQTSRGKATL